MPATLEITVNESADPTGRYLTWTPYPAQVRVVTADGPGPVSVLLRNAADNVGGLLFRQVPTEDGEDELTLQLSADGSPADLLLSGEFQKPSLDDGDAVLEAVVDGDVVAQVPFMVRIRKDAEMLTNGERDRFVSALAKLNNIGQGLFRDFRAMHTSDSSDEAHSHDAFMPWHRAYLLDLERELQAIDRSVGLPYWRFDRPAPRLFSADFLGAPAGQPFDGPGPPARLTNGHPLGNWSVDGIPGLNRHPRFADPRTSPAMYFPGRTVAPQQPLMDYMHANNVDYAYKWFDPDVEEGTPGFRMFVEGNPHGLAHTSFSGAIASIGTAARDPLFFLLHCNVDRLWAWWQVREQRFDGMQPNTYFYRGAAGGAGADKIGHNLLDTMWPWNGVVGDPRPLTAPRQPLLGSPVVAGPPPQPKVDDLIDYQGQHRSQLCGFDYDDVPFLKRA